MTILNIDVRPLRATDTDLLYAHFCDLSAWSRSKFRPHDFTMETARKFTGEGLLDMDCRRFIAIVEENGAQAAQAALCAAGYCFIADFAAERPSVGIAVGDRWQGKGVGRKMMETMIAEAKNHGKKGLRLTTDKDNLAGQALYKKCGFVITGEGEEDDYKMSLEF